MPLIRVLSNSAMQDRHWDKVNAICVSQIRPVIEEKKLS